MQLKNRAILLWLVAPVAAILVVFAVAWRVADHQAVAALEARGAATLTLRAEALAGWLKRFEPLSAIYARDPDVVRLLRGEGGAPQVARVNRRLKEWNGFTQAADTYLLNVEGVTIAASNWDKSWSFVGNDYTFRPYYRQAAAGGLGRYFALGTTSRKRGYYFSYPVRHRGRVIGVVVVKAPVARVESDLPAGGDEAFVTDQAGVIVLAGRPEWRLKTLGPLPEAALAEIRRQRQFDLSALTPVRFGGGAADGALGRFLTLSAPPAAGPGAPAAAHREMLHLSRPIGAEGWTLHLLTPTKEARAQALEAGALAAAIVLALMLVLFILVQRRRRLLHEMREREAARERMERAVQERTADLRESNARLAREVEERRAAEERLRATQRELVQAGKLAALGQMSTSLSHEFNQPLAAIRAYAENAAAFLKLDRDEEVADNLNRIARLTQRMADLSRNLTSFARKPTDAVAPVALAPVLSRSVDLLQGRLERLGVRIETECAADLKVMGGENRLQQVLVNVIGNAIDACADAETPRIRVAARRRGDLVEIAVSDNGPGVAADLQERIFDPFFTTKEAGKGLGLGLSISFNIIRDFGGAIAVENGAEGGACFRIRLQAAPISERVEA